MHLDGVGSGEVEDKDESSELYDEGDDLGHGGLFVRQHFGADEGSVEVSREEIGGCDGHDGRGHEGTDGHGGEAAAGVPLGEHLRKRSGTAALVSLV